MFRDCFQHLGEIERKRIAMPDHVQMRLNRLEKPEPWPEELCVLIGKACDPFYIQQYPDYPAFYERLASFVDAKPEEIVVGAGIEEFIRTLMLLSAGPGEKVAILWPTCAMFEIYARAFGIELVKIVADPAKPMRAEALISRLPADVRLLILANPGQPVETVFGHEDLMLIGEALIERDAVFAVDEAYHGFGAQSALGLHDRLANLVVLRTFSKAFGAAGIRLGYAVGGPDVIRPLNAVRQSGEVSAFSMHVATVLMDHHLQYVLPSIDGVRNARNKLRERIKTECGLQAWGNFANHVLIDFGSQPMRNGVRLRLGIQHILTKADFPAPLDCHMLVTCGGPELMERFFDALKAAL